MKSGFSIFLSGFPHLMIDFQEVFVLCGFFNPFDWCPELSGSPDFLSVQSGNLYPVALYRGLAGSLAFLSVLCSEEKLPGSLVFIRIDFRFLLQCLSSSSSKSSFETESAFGQFCFLAAKIRKISQSWITYQV